MRKKNIILVTGGAGFVGTNLIKLLLKKLKNQIISLDDYSSGSRLNHMKNSRVKYIKGKTTNIVKLIKNPHVLNQFFTLVSLQEFIKVF